MIESIREQDTTFVVQGNWHDEWTPKCVKSIVRYFPQSSVIISCQNLPENIYSLNYQQILDRINVPDPGETQNNLLRQIVTAKTGLNKVTTKFAIKIRSDLELVNDKLLTAYNTYLPSVSLASGFRQPVGILNIYTIHPAVLPLFPSDFIAMGLTEDVQHIFNCPLPALNVDPKEIAAKLHQDNPINPDGPLLCSDIGPERYLGWYAANTRFTKGRSFANDEEFSRSVSLMRNNYIILDMLSQAGIISLKSPNIENEVGFGCCSHAQWRALPNH